MGGERLRQTHKQQLRLIVYIYMYNFYIHFLYLMDILEINNCVSLTIVFPGSNTRFITFQMMGNLSFYLIISKAFI